MATFEIIPLAELKRRLPAKLLPLMEEYKEKLTKLGVDQRRPARPREGREP